MTSGTSVAAAIAAARGPASLGRPFIFQLPQTMMGRMPALSGVRGGTRRHGSSSRASRSMRPSARWTRDRVMSRRSASSARVASGASMRARATRWSATESSDSESLSASAAMATDWR